jgi:hypothetical protein
MNQSTSIVEITTALTKMHVSYKKESNNPFFKSKYASLGTILEAIREPLADNGLSVNQGAKPDGTGNIVIETLVSHTSGEWIQTETFIPIEKAEPQKAGSAITYGRRYALELFFCMSAEDDDGNTASRKTQPAKPKREVKIPFDMIEKDLSKLNTEEDIKNYMIKFKDSPDRPFWTPEQVKDVTDIMIAHIDRVKVEETFAKVKHDTIRELKNDMRP